MRRKVLSAAASLLAALPGTSLALGLGDIQLKSSLNAPLDAEIDLIGATAEELSGLRVQLASRDTFSRYGLDYPSFLAGITVRAAKAADGRTVIQLRSSSPITEPFVTVLVEANYGRGRQVREYSVLLDPPVFAPPAATPAPAVAAPVTGGGERSGLVARPAPSSPAPALAPAPAPAAPQTTRPAVGATPPQPRPAPAATAATAPPAPTPRPSRPAVPAPAAAAPAPSPAPTTAAGGSYQVHRGDTLSAIAGTVTGGNPAERRRAMVAIYRGNTASFDGNMNLLRSGAVLHLPDAATIASIDPADANAEIRRQSAAWHGGAVAEPAVGGTESNKLKLVPPTETGGSTQAAAPGSGAGVARGPGPTTPATGSSQQLQQRVTELEAQLAESRRLLELRSAELAQLQQARGAAPAPGAQASAEVPPASGPAATAQAPGAEKLAAAPQSKKVPPIQAPAASSGIVGLLKAFWYVPLGLLVLLAAWLGLRVARSRRDTEDEFANALAAMSDTGRQPTLQVPDPLSTTQPLRAPSIPVENSFIVEESAASGRYPAPPAPRKVVEEPVATVSVPAAEATAVDHGDPIAEADFHMAYGLYDQAADLVRLAIQREPLRRDLKLKLLEVFFVWGNKAEFLATAAELARSPGQAQPGEWENVAIMGKQIAPGDPLFENALTGAAAGGVDMNLEGGQNLVDFNLLGEPGRSGSASSVDLDLGSPKPAAPEAAKVASKALDFALDDTVQGLDDTLGESLTARHGVQALRDSQSAPAPAADPAARDDALRQKVEGAANKLGVRIDQTAEVAIDDLGLDLGDLEASGGSMLDESQVDRVLDDHADQTLIAGIEHTALTPGLPSARDDSESWLLDAGTGHEASGDTTLQPAPGRGGGVTGMHLVPADGDFDLDLDAGVTGQAGKIELTGTQRLPADEFGLHDMDAESGTMSEVGTKLDLARAYMDMGDPEGARSILAEVLSEGTATQKQEAQRLLDSIPG